MKKVSLSVAAILFACASVFANVPANAKPAKKAACTSCAKANCTSKAACPKTANCVCK